MQKTNVYRWKYIIPVAATFALSPSGWAGDNIGNINSLLQSEFKELTATLGTSLNYKAIRPARSISSLGLNIGFDINSTKFGADTFDKATISDTSNKLAAPNLHINTGLPFGFDIGAFYTAVPSSDMGLLGGELGYAVYGGGSYSPAVSIRGSFSQLTGSGELDLTTKGLELSVSKGFAFFTPYAGIGQVWIDSATNTGLENENLSKSKYFLGINFKLGLINLAAETEQLGNSTSTSAKIGVRF